MSIAASLAAFAALWTSPDPDRPMGAGGTTLDERSAAASGEGFGRAVLPETDIVAEISRRHAERDVAAFDSPLEDVAVALSDGVRDARTEDDGWRERTAEIALVAGHAGGRDVGAEQGHLSAPGDDAVASVVATQAAGEVPSLIAVAPIEPLLPTFAGRLILEAIAAREAASAADQDTPAPTLDAPSARGAAGIGRIDLAAKDPRAFAEAVEAFATWIVEKRNHLDIAGDRVAGAKLLMELAFAGGSAVSRIVIVDDGPGTIQPYRLTHDIGVMSVDHVPVVAPAEGSPVVLGVPALGELAAIGWLAA